MAKELEKEAELEQTRKKIFEDSKFIPNNQKYGLFSFSGTLAVSKHSYFEAKKSKKTKDGTVDSGPKNFVAGCTKKGKSPDCYFSYPEYQSERYFPIQQPFRSEKERADLMKKKHDVNWKPASSVIEKISLYEHQDSPVAIKKNQKRQNDGTVRLEPRNFLTSPAKKGSYTPDITFGKYPEYISDPYELKNKSFNKHKGMTHDSPFKSMDFGNKTFQKDEKVYGEEPENKKNLKKRQISHDWVKHDLPFKPSKGIPDVFEKYPEYIPNPAHSIRRKVPSEEVPWKSVVNQRSCPSPSITKNLKNLKTEFPSLRF